MAADIDDTRRALQPTMLRDLPLGRLPGDCLEVGGVDPAQVRPAWQAARAVLPRTRRRPVFLSAEPHVLDGFPAARSDAEDALLDRQARTADPWPPPGTAWWEIVVPEEEVCLYVREVPGADLLTEAEEWAAGRTAPITVRKLNRFLFDRVRTDPDLLAAVPGDDRLTGGWYEPDAVRLVLLPFTEPHLVAGRTDFWGTLARPDRLAAILWQWHQRWAAEPVACWDTMLQFTVGRRPASAEAAWDLAVQIKHLATNLEMDLWEIAVAVTRGDTWFLHSRP
ncbi:DUF4253 domain-containing protein [Actinoplanes utahensis]|uniref:DUF4253 domain-containing protein n=1 Tax=Actinoplanes utahensis TaxID=1869 RepID=A0A0A6UWH3_ACTUT|nr:DUF4253 domain-containing protein [Actinoplanes utahensis]KHD78759.1 hypothetical protein MB27_03835 [Actinoplanes utahensis]GIF32123.1 hypothetical protein Aut01nite_51090 [Actinoplanes utahensis]